MKTTFTTPGVYVEEISTRALSIRGVETALPGFIGYTQKAEKDSEGDLILIPTRISSLAEYERLFGKARTEATGVIAVTFPVGNRAVPEAIVQEAKQSPFVMYYAMQMFFANGGQDCYIVSVDVLDEKERAAEVQTAPPSQPSIEKLREGLKTLRTKDDPTLIVIPDGPNLASDEFYALQRDALTQCAELQERFAIIDVKMDDHGEDDGQPAHEVFREKIGDKHLKYGAAYYPYLQTDIRFEKTDENVTVMGLGHNKKTLADLRDSDPKAYRAAVNATNRLEMILPPSSAVAGVYAHIDRTRGVWKAPANVDLKRVKRPTILVDTATQEDLNVHESGKSINVIRSFTGRGVLIWGARTLAGNDNEWRYVPVRRFFNFVEESVKKGTQYAVFEPNDVNTWQKLRAAIENFLVTQWRAGALQGATPEEAFYVRVGLGETMTALDIHEGRLIVEIGMAAVRPAEFIILKFSHKMLSA